MGRVNPSTPSARARSLVAGPRGRRLLLELALALDAEADAVSEATGAEPSLQELVFRAARGLETSGSRSARYGTEEPGPQEVPETLVRAISAHLDRSDPGKRGTAPRRLHDALLAVVDSASYWGPGDGIDALAAFPQIIAPLSRLAERVCAAPHTSWWWGTAESAAESQWEVAFENQPWELAPEDSRAALLAERKAIRSRIERARRERAALPPAALSGEWWSCPSFDLRSSTRAPGAWSSTGEPLGLSTVEDRRGWERAEARRLSIPDGARVLEIASAADWARTCRDHPLDVTPMMRDMWREVTGRDGRWVIPDWAAVAETWDAVHLQVGAYLAAAGTAIPVDEGTASVIAGFDPDRTAWFTDRVRRAGEPVAWRLREPNGRERWVRVAE